ncbi:hypothetical protein ACFSZS_24035 [Seohaeicola zhoushanensis]
MSVLDNVALALQAREGHSFRFLRPARSIAHLRDRGASCSPASAWPTRPTRPPSR